MPNSSLDEALKEVYSLSNSNDYDLNTFIISHSTLPTAKYLIQDIHEASKDRFLTIETGQTFPFRSVPLRYIPPGQDGNGLQEMTLAIGNVDREVSDFLESVDNDSREPIIVEHRVFLNSDSTAPRTDTPLVMHITDFKVTAFEVTAQAKFTNILNMPYPNENYTRESFVGLGN
ncbi:DUF1833 domain-containing protein [Akkermansiaceae bacterium]|nr:DUF1833 domain-containing protein [Akkermansiaceae bacterium]